MSVELQIIEHKECLRCFQPIDQRADICPFCQSSQKVRSRIRRPLLIGALVTLFLLLPILWWSLSQVQSSNDQLQQDLVATQAQLSETQSNLELLASSNAAASLRQRELAEKELDQLIARLTSYTDLAATLCSQSTILSKCTRALRDSAQDNLALAKVLGVYQAIGAEQELCDRLRPALLQLSRYSQTGVGHTLLQLGLSPEMGLGHTLNQRYFASTASCWG